MPPFPKPSFTSDYRLDVQIQAVREWEKSEPTETSPDKAALEFNSQRGASDCEKRGRIDD